MAYATYNIKNAVLRRFKPAHRDLFPITIKLAKESTEI